MKRSWPAERPAYLAFLPGFLFRADGPKGHYVVKAWPVSLVPAVALAALVGTIFPDAAPPDLVMKGALPIFLIVVAAPLIETLIMIGPLLVLNRLLGPGPAVVASALGWAIAHSSAAPTWGLAVWWPFLILSIAFLTWRKRGLGWSILVVATVHALHNAAGVAIFLLLQ